MGKAELQVLNWSDWTPMLGVVSDKVQRPARAEIYRVKDNTRDMETTADGRGR